MLINVQIVPGAKVESIEKKTDLFGGEVYKVKVHAKPIDGEANEALVDFLSKYYKVPKKNVKIVQGFTARNKVVEIIEN